MKTTQPQPSVQSTLSPRHAEKLLKAADFIGDCINGGCLGEGDEIAARVALACLYSEYCRAKSIPNDVRLNDAIKHADKLAKWNA